MVFESQTKTISLILQGQQGTSIKLTPNRGLTQTKAGILMGVSQPEVSRLFKGNFREYSVDRLMAFLTAFDRYVEIVSRPRIAASEGNKGTIRFKPAAE